MSRSSFLRTRRRRPWGAEPGLTPEPPETLTEAEQARRAMREWLRERDEETTVEFDGDEMNETC